MHRRLERRSAPAQSPAFGLRDAIDDYLALSRSPLRTSDSGWYERAESAAWQRLCAAAGIVGPGGHDAA